LLKSAFKEFMASRWAYDNFTGILADSLLLY